jgi:hypothetical protein
VKESDILGAEGMWHGQGNVFYCATIVFKPLLEELLTEAWYNSLDTFFLICVSAGMRHMQFCHLGQNPKRDRNSKLLNFLRMLVISSSTTAKAWIANQKKGVAMQVLASDSAVVRAL